jgi:hypothetical protein
MGPSDSPENDTPDSNTLLSQILVVLKRIDTHLEVQEGRIADLDSKVTAFTRSGSSADVTTKRVQETTTERHGRINTSLSLERPRTSSLPQITPSSRRRDLLSQTTRNLSIASGPARSSLSRSLTEDVNNNEPVTRSPSSLTNAQKVDSLRNAVPESPKERINSIQKFGPGSRTPTWGSHSPPPTTADADHGDHAIENHDPESYEKYPPPQSWIVTRSQGRVLDVKYGPEEAQGLWAGYIGDSWTIPPDGRIEMTFQQHILERLEKDQVVSLLETLKAVSSKLEYSNPKDLTKRGSFKVTDYEFDPKFEESVAEYRADIPTGQFRKHRVKGIMRRTSFGSTQSAPWKRVM